MLDGELVEADTGTNTVRFKAFLSDRSEIVTFGAPLEDVEAVWQSPPGWSVRL